MMLDLTPHLITWKKNSDTLLVIDTPEGDFSVPDAEVLIYRKQALHWISTKQIGDGLQLIVGFPLTPLTIDEQSYIRGMSLYTAYDETTNQRQTYLYKFPKNDAWKATIQRWFSLHWRDYTITPVDRFLTLAGVKPYEIATTQRLISPTRTRSELCSFLVGMCVAYGNVPVTKNPVLHTWTVSLPYVEHIDQYIDLLPQLRTALSAWGIFFTLTRQTQKIGYSLQITIHDREILQLLTTVLPDHRESIPKHDFFTKQFPELLEKFSWENSLDFERISLYSPSVWKFLSK